MSTVNSAKSIHSFLTNNLGEPTKSIKVPNYFTCEWLINNIRIRYEQRNKDKNKNQVHLYIEESECQEDLKNLVTIRLSGKQQSTGDYFGEEDDYNALIIIDFNRNKILYRNRNIFADIFKINDNFIRAKRNTDDGGYIELIIDRVLGTFTMKGYGDPDIFIKPITVTKGEYEVLKKSEKNFDSCI